MNKIILIFLLTSHSFSAIPPVESLFRNGHYQQIELDTIVVKLRVREILELNLTEESNLSEKERFDRYYKLIFNKNQWGRFEFLQIEYADAAMKKRSVRTLYGKKSFLKYLEIKTHIDVVRDLFWGAMISLLLGESRAISTFLKKTNRDYKTNKEIMNRSRKHLYDRYKQYLQAIKDEPELKATLPSPLAPNDPGQKDKISKLIASPFYVPSRDASLIKEGDRFYILVKLEKTSAKFTNKDFKLTELLHHDLGGDVKLEFFDYKRIGRVNEAPQNILLRYFGEKYHIQIISLRHTSYKPKSLDKIKKSFQKALQSNKSKKSYIAHPRFLF